MRITVLDLTENLIRPMSNKLTGPSGPHTAWLEAIWA
jgi:hypothetical protein